MGPESIDREYRAASSGPSAANAAATLTVPPRGGARIAIGYLAVSYSAAPAGGRLTITDSDVPKHDMDITTAGPTLPNLPGGGLVFEAGQAVTLVLAAAGAAVVGKINIGWRYVYDR